MYIVYMQHKIYICSCLARSRSLCIVLVANVVLILIVVSYCEARWCYCFIKKTLYFLFILCFSAFYSLHSDMPICVCKLKCCACAAAMQQQLRKKFNIIDEKRCGVYIAHRISTPFIPTDEKLYIRDHKMDNLNLIYIIHTFFFLNSSRNFLSRLRINKEWVCVCTWWMPWLWPLNVITDVVWLFQPLLCCYCCGWMHFAGHTYFMPTPS